MLGMQCNPQTKIILGWLKVEFFRVSAHVLVLLEQYDRLRQQTKLIYNEKLNNY